MIFFVHGEERDKARAKWRELISAFENKYPEANRFTLEVEHWSPAVLEELALGETLFNQKFLVTADHFLTNPEIIKEVERNFLALIASPNVFLFLETEIPLEILKLTTKHGVKVYEFKLTKAKNVKPLAFNIFSLTDAFATRDRRRAWLLYQEALGTGLAAEEIFWKLVWQIKTLLLVKMMDARPVASLKPFVLSKARRAATRFSSEELENFSERLITVYQAARRGEGEFELGLERLLLEL